MVVEMLNRSGLGGFITYPIGTVGANRQLEAAINAVRPMTAAVMGFIPEGKGNYDVVPTFNQISVGGKIFDSNAVAAATQNGDPVATRNWLISIGIMNGFVNEPSTPTVRAMEMVDSVSPLKSNVQVTSAPPSVIGGRSISNVTNDLVNEMEEMIGEGNNKYLLIGGVVVLAFLLFKGK